MRRPFTEASETNPVTNHQFTFLGKLNASINQSVCSSSLLSHHQSQQSAASSSLNSPTSPAAKWTFTTTSTSSATVAAAYSSFEGAASLPPPSIASLRSPHPQHQLAHQYTHEETCTTPHSRRLISPQNSHSQSSSTEITSVTNNSVFQELRHVVMHKIRCNDRFGLKLKRIGKSVFISHILYGSYASNVGLKMGDQIVRIDHRPVSDFEMMDDMMDHINSANCSLLLTYKPRTVVCRIKNVQLIKPVDSLCRLGLRLEKRAEGVFITKVIEYSPAYEADLKVDDEILRINNQDVSFWSHDKVIFMLRHFWSPPPSLQCTSPLPTTTTSSPNQQKVHKSSHTNRLAKKSKSTTTAAQSCHVFSNTTKSSKLMKASSECCSPSSSVSNSGASSCLPPIVLYLQIRQLIPMASVASSLSMFENSIDITEKAAIQAADIDLEACSKREFPVERRSLLVEDYEDDFKDNDIDVTKNGDLELHTEDFRIDDIDSQLSFS